MCILYVGIFIIIRALSAHWKLFVYNTHLAILLSLLGRVLVNRSDFVRLNWSDGSRRWDSMRRIFEGPSLPTYKVEGNRRSLIDDFSKASVVDHLLPSLLLNTIWWWEISVTDVNVIMEWVDPPTISSVKGRFKRAQTTFWKVFFSVIFDGGAA